MKKVLSFLKRNVVIHITLGIFIGVMGAVYVIYSNAEVSSGLSAGSVAISKTNMSEVPEATLQSALDYLYEKAELVGQAGTCPEGYSCIFTGGNPGYLPENDSNVYEQSTFVQNLQIGDLIKMTPSSIGIGVRLDGSKSGFNTANGASSTTYGSVTYYPYDDTFHPTYLNPSELEYWRVIRKNTNGTVDVVSEYVSSVTVYFYGVAGYANLVGYLNELASYYENSTYTVGSRHMGYNGQTQYITDASSFNGSTNQSPGSSTLSPTSGTPAQEEYGGGVLGDTLYYTDYNLVKIAYGNSGNSSLIAKKNIDKTTETPYWLASRRFSTGSASSLFFFSRAVGASGSISSNTNYLRYYDNGWYNRSCGYALRPILTLRATITSSGTESGTGAYILG